MREKHVTLGRKKLTIGGMNKMSLNLTDIPTNQEDNNDNEVVAQREKYTEDQFRECRESILEM